MNRKYPKNIGDKVETDMYQSTNTSDLEYIQNIFNDKNIFIVNLDDGDEIADNIGIVDIEANKSQTDEFRAYEDYYNDQNYLKYDDNDPQCLKFLHIGEIDNKNSIISDIKDEDFKGMTRNEFVNHMLQKYNVDIYGLKSEELPDTFSEADISFNIDSGCIDLDNSCKIYVNYKKNSDNKLVLYFNYFNYMETPYIKIKDGDQYPDIIDNTYLKLNPDESGILDVVVQFRYYYGNKLYGIKNIKTLSYMVYNVSDDKPKFVMKKIYTIRKGESQLEQKPVSVSIKAGDINIDIDGMTSEEKTRPIHKKFNIFMEKTGELKSDMEFYVDYPSEIMKITSDSYSGCILDKTTDGYLHVTVTKKSMNTVSLDVEFKSAYDLLRFSNSSYMLGIDKCDLIDVNGFVADVITTDGYLTIDAEQSGTYVLGATKPGQQETKPLTIEKETTIKITNAQG